MRCSNRLKQWYVDFVDVGPRNAGEWVCYLALRICSYAYGAVVIIRNFLYDKKIVPIHSISAKIISVGNVAWAGAGKTQCALWLFKKLSPQFKTAIVRRGYGADENQLCRDAGANVLIAVNRVRLVQTQQAHYNLFILDDGFQYRKLYRDINILIMSAREFKRPYGLIPVNFFREPMRAIKRADVLIINYYDELPFLDTVVRAITQRAPQLEIFYAKYVVSSLCDLSGKPHGRNSLLKKKVAVFTATGYPKGVVRTAATLGCDIAHVVVYPDHSILSETELRAIEADLMGRDITILLITRKDRYHLPPVPLCIDVYVFDVDMVIEREEDFLKFIAARLEK